ncbi:MAG: 1-acyl-sn-glycerol-3-phosphate acyltransferase [Bacteroidota bacterium]|nr:1-acyl-sn-glycerol-3-phosphate acyltransferase [Bacteroidota bacterium]
MEEVPKVIDIREIVRSSNSGFFRNLPGFMISTLEKLICQDEMNDTIYRHRDKTGLSFINDVLEGWNVRTETRGIENIPSSGRFIFVSNHPLGAIDALAFLIEIGKYYPDLVTPSNEMLNRVTNIQPVLFGVNVYGKNSRETAEKLNRLFESDKQVMMFPSGEVSRRKNGIISDPQWQKTIITKAVQYKRDILPAHISGRNSNLFYFVANLRTFLGIKMFIESALLPREMVRQWNSKVTLTFGRAIPFTSFTNEKTPHEWAQYVKEIVYKLGQ